jgi:hypothetical protein
VAGPKEAITISANANGKSRTTGRPGSRTVIIGAEVRVRVLNRPKYISFIEYKTKMQFKNKLVM